MHNTDDAQGYVPEPANGHHGIPPHLIEAVARKLRGEPNRQRSTKNDIRYGTHGSLSINVSKGTFYDFEADIGGGILDFIERTTGDTGNARWKRLEELTGYKPEPNGGGHGSKEIETLHKYQLENGNEHFQVVRFFPKNFRIRYSDGKGGWIWKMPLMRRHLPYRLPELLEAVSKETAVFIVEGEKDVENGRNKLNIIATCNAGGAGKWTAEHAEHLKGADVIIIPDNDDPGRQHAESVAASLFGKAKRVRVLPLPGLSPKGDLSDWIAAGGAAEQLWALVEQAPDWQPSSDGDETPDLDLNDAVTWPVLDQKAMHGVAGDLARLATANTEADPVAVLATTLTWVGALFGRARYMRIGDDRHHPRLFTCLVGASARARKGTSMAPVRTVLENVDLLLGTDEPLNVVSGLSTGEGLIAYIRDPIEDDDDHNVEQGKPRAGSGTDDKRLMVIETELGRVLRAASRQGSTVTAVIRQAWDGEKLGIITKAEPMTATDPHVVVLGHVTRTELTELLQKDDIWNGFTNRFLWVCVRRRRLVPFPVGLSDADIPRIASTIATAVRHAWSAQSSSITFSDDARKLWGAIYPDITAELPGVLGVVTARAEAQIHRLALTYALLDCADAVGVDHLEAALAFHQYAMDSARFIFAASGEVSRDPVTEGILALLATGPKTQTELRDLFGRHLKKGALGTALQGLQERRQVVFRLEPTKGRPKRVWTLTPTKAT